MWYRQSEVSDFAARFLFHKCFWCVGERAKRVEGAPGPCNLEVFCVGKSGVEWPPRLEGWREVTRRSWPPCGSPSAHNACVGSRDQHQTLAGWPSLFFALVSRTHVLYTYCRPSPPPSISSPPPAPPLPYASSIGLAWSVGRDGDVLRSGIPCGLRGQNHQKAVREQPRAHDRRLPPHGSRRG